MDRFFNENENVSDIVLKLEDCKVVHKVSLLVGSVIGCQGLVTLGYFFLSSGMLKFCNTSAQIRHIRQKRENRGVWLHEDSTPPSKIS